MVEKRDFKGIWIDKSIWLSKNLTLQEKVFLVEIDSLDRDEKGCYAGNKYFSTFFGLSLDRCSDVISSLAKKNMIIVQIDKSSGKSVRKILSLATLPTRRKSGVGIGEKAEWPLRGNAVPNNTEENNTDNNSITAIAENNEARKLFNLFKNVRPSYEQLFKRKHEWDAARRLLKKIPFEELEKVINFLPKSNTMPYAPVVTSPSELEDKLEKLRAFWIKEKQKSNINKIISVR